METSDLSGQILNLHLNPQLDSFLAAGVLGVLFPVARITVQPFCALA